MWTKTATACVLTGVLALATIVGCGSSNNLGFTGGDIGAGTDAGATGGANAGGGSSNGGSANGGSAGSAGSSTGGVSNGGSGNGGSAGSGGVGNGGNAGASAGAGGESGLDAGDTDAAFTDGGSLGPTVSILHPGVDDRKVNASIYFHGIASDPTDGTLTGNALVWTDSVEGQFGTGDPVNWTPTVTGLHTITLRATDSLGYTAADSIIFAIKP